MRELSFCKLCQDTPENEVRGNQKVEVNYEFENMKMKIIGRCGLKGLCSNFKVF